MKDGTTIVELATLFLGVFVPLVSGLGAAWMSKIQRDIKIVKLTIDNTVNLANKDIKQHTRDIRLIGNRLNRHSTLIDKIGKQVDHHDHLIRTNPGGMAHEH